MNSRHYLASGSRFARVLTAQVALWVAGSLAAPGQAAAPAAESIVFKRYNLSCLAPLLENLNAEEPKTLAEAYLHGPTGLLSPVVEGEQLAVDRVGAGAVHFPITTEFPEAQAHFNRGIALLHTMWYREAERAFRSVVQIDPGCAMGYWGLAMANERQTGRARLFARTAMNKTSVNRPQLEQRWIDILADYYEVPRMTPGGKSPTESASDPPAETPAALSAGRIRSLEDLVMDFPGDVEAKAFLLRQLTLDKYRVGVSITSHLGVEQLADELAAMAPKHPSRHYPVFLWLERRPGRAIPHAEVAPTLSPAVAEVWRYAGEGYADAGRMQEALLLYEAAVRADHRFMEEKEAMPWQTQNLTANYEVLIATLASMGRSEEALGWARRAARFPRASVSSPADAANDLPSLARQHSVVAMSGAGRWEDLLGELRSGSQFQSPGTFADQAGQLFWQGLARLFLDRPDEAAATATALEQVMVNALKKGVSNQAEASITTAIRSLDQCRKFLEAANPVPLEVGESHPFLTPLVLMQLYEKAGLTRHAAAIAQARAGAHPHLLLPVADHCYFAFKTGNRRDAFFQMNRRFRNNAAYADVDSPTLRRLAAVAREMQLPTPWTLRTAPPRPRALPDDLDSIGPLAWTPATASELNLPDHTGRKHRLADFKGKPVLLNFFLGVTCPFCVKQLNTFKPHLPAFREAGIEFVAVSTDPVAVLQKRFEGGGGTADAVEADFPFLVLADPDLSVFRSYRAFDEFEDGPLHATVLLDGKGRVLWADRGHAPFDSPEALLEEATRLFALFEKPE